MLNCFSVCSSCCWLPAKYAEMALWKRRSCLCITFTWGREPRELRKLVCAYYHKEATSSQTRMQTFFHSECWWWCRPTLPTDLILLQEFEFNGDVWAEAFILVLLDLVLLLSGIYACHGYSVPRTHTQFLQVWPVGIELQSGHKRSRENTVYRPYKPWFWLFHMIDYCICVYLFVCFFAQISI